jgi:hypothetical protein
MIEGRQRGLAGNEAGKDSRCKGFEGDSIDKLTHLTFGKITTSINLLMLRREKALPLTLPKSDEKNSG